MTLAIEGQTTLPRSGTYRIDPARSTVSFRATHVGDIFPFRGTFSVRSGELIAADPPEMTSGTVVIDAASWSTGNAMRDHHVRGWQFLDVAKFPEIVFSLQAVESVEGGGAGWRALGSVLAHGVSQPVEVRVSDVRVEPDGEVRLRASTSIDRYDFRVGVFPSMAGRRLDLEFEVVAEPVTAGKAVAA